VDRGLGERVPRECAVQFGSCCGPLRLCLLDRLDHALCRSKSHRCWSRRYGGHWDHVQMIVSLLYKVSRRLLCVPAVLLRRDTSKDAELLVLRHENAVLRRQITARVRYEEADRLWFAALSWLLARRHWHAVFPVQPCGCRKFHP
jgi:hypothetical protein